MHVRFPEFDPEKFSFHRDPVLILEGFWSPEERARFRDAMRRAQWKTLSEMPEVSQAFQNCGNWTKAEIVPPERGFLLKRLSLPCVMGYVESFPNVKQHHVTSNYYTYAAGDCLSLHSDLDEGYSSDPRVRAAIRRLAMVTYLHDEWQPDWGGELIIYEGRPDRQGKLLYEITHCIAPDPGAVVFFTVPRLHRVCRVDALAGDHKRLSIAGWVMTEH